MSKKNREAEPLHQFDAGGLLNIILGCSICSVDLCETMAESVRDPKKKKEHEVESLRIAAKVQAVVAELKTKLRVQGNRQRKKAQ